MLQNFWNREEKQRLRRTPQHFPHHFRKTTHPLHVLFCYFPLTILGVLWVSNSHRQLPGVLPAQLGFRLDLWMFCWGKIAVFPVNHLFFGFLQPPGFELCQCSHHLVLKMYWYIQCSDTHLYHSLRRQKRDLQFESSLGYTARLCKRPRPKIFLQPSLMKDGAFKSCL